MRPRMPLLLAAAVPALGLTAPAAMAVAEAGQAPFRIALVSDPHVTRGVEEDQALYKGRFDRVIAAVNDAKVDLVLIVGDLTQSGKPEEIADYAAQVRGFAAPVRHVFGNHDVGAKHLPGKPGTTAERVARLEAGLGPSFFVDVRGGGTLRVIGVNGSLFGSGLPREADQWAFLEAEMAARPPAAGTTTLLLTHYPPFLKTFDEPGGDYWNIEPAPRQRLLALLKKGGVRAVLSGHLHRPLRGEHDGIRYITTHPVSFGLPRGKQPQGWTLVTVGADGAITAEERNLLDDTQNAL